MHMSLPATFDVFFRSRWSAVDVTLGADWTRKHDIHFLDDALQGEVPDVLIWVRILAQRTLFRLKKKNDELLQALFKIIVIISP